MDDWEEIKRLAADFQRTQTTDTLQRISERNCIDIVKKLTELKLIDIIYTPDGKELITPEYLLKEIEDVIYVSGGRMHLNDLASTLNVYREHVQTKAIELVKDKPDEYILLADQVIHSNYKNNLGKQIYDTILVNGQFTIADFAKTLDLPSEFLLTVIKDVLPKYMDDYVASTDGTTFYTSDMMDRYKSIIAGTLTAISTPTSVAAIIKRLDIPERLFIPTVNGLIKANRIEATIENRTFIPSIYAREQNEWIDKFYSSNSFIEYDVLSRKNINQPKTFLKNRFPDGLQLKSCFVSPSLVSQVESLFEDSIASNSWIDIATILPPAIQSEDIDQLLVEITKRNKHLRETSMIIDQTIVCSLGYIAACKESFNSLMQLRAQEQLKEGKLVSYFLGGKLKKSSNKTIEKGENETSKNTNDEPISTAEEENKNPKKTIKEPDQMADDKFAPTPEDIKREKRNKKGRSEVIEHQESDDEQGNKKSKGRKSGGGSQGREIKQRSVKKKYNPGNKGSQKANNDSDEETTTIAAKTPRSQKGRSARRAISPEPRSKNVSQEKEPLIFMTTEEIVDRLKKASNESGSENFLDFVAKTIEKDLNSSYMTVANQTLDEYLKSEEEKETCDLIDDTAQIKTE